MSAEQEIYDRILTEHLERKEAAIAERRQREVEWQEYNALEGMYSPNGHGTLVNE